MDVSPRTVFRTIESLRELGINISGDQNGYRIKGDTFLPSLNFTLEEALAIVFASKGSFPFEDILGEEFEGAIIKLKSSLPPYLLSRINEMERSTAIFRGPYTPLSPEHRLFFKTLEDGVRSKRSVDALYQATGEKKPVRRRIDPYRVFYRHHSWYVVGYSHEEKGVRLFRLNRFTRANLTPFSFEIQKEFPLEFFLESAFQVIGGTDLKEVVIKFEPSIASLIEEVVWHPTQKLKKTRNGRLLFSVKVAEPREVLRWALSWGDKAEILRPPELRDEARIIARELVRKYSKGVTG